MSRYSHKLLVLIPALFACALLTFVSCSSDDKTGSAQKQTDTGERDKAGESASDDFFTGKPELALIFSSSRANSTFDLQEAVELKVELYSPRYSVYQTYKKTIGAGKSVPDLSGLILGSEDSAWSDNLALFEVSDDEETPVPFVFATAPQLNQLKLGAGDIGLLHLLISPGYFAQAGSYTFRLTYVENGSQVDLAGETSVILRDDGADELQKNLSMIRYLTASGKTQEALTLAFETVQAQPESYNARVALGRAHEESGELSEALSTYEKSLSLFRDEGIDHVPEAPRALWLKIRELRAKLKE